MPEPRIYIDFDDVLCETARALVDIAAAEFGRRARFEDLHSFDIGESLGLSPDQVERVMRIAHEPETLLAFQPTEGAREALAAWTARGYAACIVTGRPPATAPACREWLADRSIPYAQLVFVDKYARGHPDTGDAHALSLDGLARQSFCLAVDDAPQMLRFLAETMAIPVAAYSRPWNRALDAQPHFRITPCRDWGEILERFPDPRRTPHARAARSST